MKEFLWKVVPGPCFTFGPLFMTRVAGTASNDVGNELVLAGVLMLALGLFTICYRIEDQRKEIARLLSERQVAK